MWLVLYRKLRLLRTTEITSCLCIRLGAPAASLETYTHWDSMNTTAKQKVEDMISLRRLALSVSISFGGLCPDADQAFEVMQPIATRIHF